MGMLEEFTTVAIVWFTKIHEGGWLIRDKRNKYRIKKLCLSADVIPSIRKSRQELFFCQELEKGFEMKHFYWFMRVLRIGSCVFCVLLVPAC